MMGRQIIFCFVPEDLKDFEAVLRERDGVVLDYFHPRGQLAFLNSLSYEESTESQIWLARRQDLGDVRLRYLSQQRRWIVDQNASPVVELSRGGFDGKGLPQGRLYFDVAYLDREVPRVVRYPPDFLDWAGGLLRWIRQHSKRALEHDCYVGRHARKWLEMHRSETGAPSGGG